MNLHNTLFKPEVTHSQARTMSSSLLAYLGDAVYELFIRSRELMPVRRINDYHHCVVSHVKAESQAKMAQYLQPLLTEQEREIFRRARNASAGKPKRVSLLTYQQATGFEALLGFLYLTDTSRLMELLTLCSNSERKG